MKFQALPGTINNDGSASQRQHLSCFVIDDRVAIDAGSLAFAADEKQKEQIRDVVLTHGHLDHIAGLPLFIDDLFASLEEPVSIYALEEVNDVLKKHIFNWEIYPDFAQLENENGIILEYCNFEKNCEFSVKHLQIKAIEVNHKVPSVGFVISDGTTKIAISGDTAASENFWNAINSENKIDALLIECAFPDHLFELANASHHLTPKILKTELENFKHKNTPIFVINLKPMYREQVVREIKKLKIENIKVLKIGEVYDW